MYFLEYVCTTCWADRAWRNYEKGTGNWFEDDSYAVLSFTYQVGVFFSRTSIQCFRFPWVTALTIAQAVFFLLWMFVAIWPGWMNIWFQIVLMLFVGFMGGCSYSNCMYYVLESPDLTKRQKEVTINIGSMFYDAGVFIAAVSSLLISSFALPDSDPSLAKFIGVAAVSRLSVATIK